MSKVKFGLKNVYYAKATVDTTNNTATYAAPVRWPGAVNLSMEAQGDSTKFYADDGVYYTVSTNNGYEGDLESAKIPDSFAKDILGDKADEKGVNYDDTAATTQTFALLFEFAEDVRARRYVLYNCSASRPAIEGSTKGESTEVKTETVTITAAAIHNANLNVDMTKSYTDEQTDKTVYDGWYTEVYQPAAASAEG